MHLRFPLQSSPALPLPAAAHRLNPHPTAPPIAAEAQEALQSGVRPLRPPQKEPPGEDEPLTNQGPPRAQGVCGGRLQAALKRCGHSFCEALCTAAHSKQPEAGFPPLPAGDQSQAAQRRGEEPGEAHPGSGAGTGLKQSPTAATAAEGGEAGEEGEEASSGAVAPSTGGALHAAAEVQRKQLGQAADAARDAMWTAKAGGGEEVAGAGDARATEAGQGLAVKAATAAQGAKATAAEAGQAAASKATAAGQAAKQGAQQAAATVQGTATGGPRCIEKMVAKGLLHLGSRALGLAASLAMICASLVLACPACSTGCRSSGCGARQRVRQQGGAAAAPHLPTRLHVLLAVLLLFHALCTLIDQLFSHPAGPGCGQRACRCGSRQNRAGVFSLPFQPLQFVVAQLRWHLSTLQLPPSVGALQATKAAMEKVGEAMAAGGEGLKAASQRIEGEQGGGGGGGQGGEGSEPGQDSSKEGSKEGHQGQPNERETPAVGAAPRSKL